MAAIRRILILLSTVVGCVLIVLIGGFLLGAGGRVVCLAAFVPAAVGYFIARRKGMYHFAAFSFALSVAAGFGLWLTEN